MATVAWLVAMESELGSPEAFRSVFPVLLVDRLVKEMVWVSRQRALRPPGRRGAPPRRVPFCLSAKVTATVFAMFCQCWRNRCAYIGNQLC